MNIRSAKFSEENHCYTDPRDGRVKPSVTQILAANGLISYNGVKQSVLDLKAIIGTEAHSACAFVDRGVTDLDIDPRVQPYLDAYCDLKAKLNWKPLVVENGDIGPAISDVNGMAVGFKVDRIGMLNGVEAIAEIKCTSDVEPHMGLQLAGYDLCTDGRRKRVVFQLFPDGKFKLWDDSEKGSRVFTPNDYQMFSYSLFSVYFRHDRCIQRIEELVNGG